MSDSSPINTALSSGSYNSPKRLNSEEVQLPFPNSNSPVSQQNSSQNAREVSSLTNNLLNLISCQQIAAQTFLCPHNIVTTCVCCSQQGSQGDISLVMKNFAKLYRDSLEKAQNLEESLGNFKKKTADLQRRVADLLSPIKKELATWFEDNVKKLCSINQKIQQDLVEAQQSFLKNERLNKDIEFLENQIKVLKGDFKDLKELDHAYSKEELFRFEIQEKMKVIQKMFNSLIVPDINDLSTKLRKIVSFDEKAIMKVSIPVFVNRKLSGAADMDASTMISSLSSRL